jgi:hypothetical protein
MNLQNGYKVIYAEAANGIRTFKASKSGLFADAEVIAELEIGKYKLIYEKNGKIYCSESGIPAENDQPTNAFDKVFAEDESADDTDVEEPVQEAHAEAITINGDSHGELTVNGNVVTLNATGTIELATNPNGNTYHHVGFKITAPDGIDPANVVITRPDGKTRVMANILDGANYTNMYWRLTENDRVFTYYIDWDNDGVSDLTVIIDASKVTLGVKSEAD